MCLTYHFGSEDDVVGKCSNGVVESSWIHHAYKRKMKQKRAFQPSLLKEFEEMEMRIGDARADAISHFLSRIN